MWFKTLLINKFCLVVTKLYKIEFRNTRGKFLKLEVKVLL